MKKLPSLILLSVILLLFSNVIAFAKEKKNVLYLNSYHQGYRWSDKLLEGIRSVMNTSAYKVDLQIEYMDAKKYNYDYIESRLFRLYREKFKEELFDVIIVSDNDALNFVQNYRERMFDGVDVVFCGVNGIESVDLTGGDITGVVESFDLISTLEMAKILHPGTNKMVVVGDQSTTGKAIERQVRALMAAYDNTFRIEFWFQLTLEETQERMVDLADDTFLFFTPWYQTVKGKFYTAEEVVEAISEGSTVPIYTTWEFLLGNGVVGGRMLSGYHHGQVAGEMALRILDGERAADIPVILEPEGQYMFDHNVMEKLKIDQHLLPEGAIVINRPKAIYEVSKELFWTIAISFVLLLLTLISLVVTMVGRRESERKVIEQLSFQGTLMDTIPQLVSWKNNEGRYLGANKAFIQFFGIGDIDAVVGRHTEDVVDYEDYVQWSSEADRSVVKEKRAIRKVRKKINQGEDSLSWLEVNKVPLLDPQGRVVGVLSTAENVTKEQNLEKQLLQSQKMEALGTLAGGIAHDFNNILTSILNSTELALDDVPPESQTAKDLRRVLKAARRGGSIVKQILSFSRPSKEKFRITDLNIVVHEVLSLIDASLPSTISVKTDLDVPHMFVNADPAQIHQVVLNLCTNGYHALRENGGELSVGLSNAIIKREKADTLDIRPGNYVKIYVSDNGPGIRPAILHKIFDPFFTTRDLSEGTGLGLAVVHGIVKGHLGGVEVQSELGKGTTVSVYLPKSKSSSLLSRETITDKSDEKFSILFVEDDEDQLNSTPRLLREMGHRVEGISDPLEALEIIKKSKESFDVVITDYDMPNMNGIELAQECKDLPCILVSGREGAVSDAEKYANIVQVLVKPYDKFDLAEVLAAYQALR
jgi:two-component system, cell cycle sensor histidine kinase and response regulator CckA